MSPDDVVGLVADRVTHVDCQRPRGLTPEERALLHLFCQHHATARCTVCRQSFFQHELVADMLAKSTNLCPRCHADLTESLRAHLSVCALMPEEVYRRARETRAATRRLVKESHQLADKANVLMREAEAAVAALRETMKRLTGARDS